MKNGCALRPKKERRQTTVGTELLMIGLALTAALLVTTQPVAAQSAGAASSKATVPAANLEEQFNGLWGDSENQMPPGFPPYATTNPFRTIEKVIAPLLQPWAAARKESTIFEIEEVGAFCRPTGLLLRHQNRGFQLVVSPGRITMVGAQLPGNPIRRIYLNRDHPKNLLPTSAGDSIGHWEGDTLVVDTIGFDETTLLSLEGSRHSEELHIVERMRLVADGKWLERRFVVDDPKALKAPFTMVRYQEKLPADTRPELELCLGFENWREWVKIRNDAVRAVDEQRAEEARALAQKKK
jgi:hypothetical protein